MGGGTVEGIASIPNPLSTRVRLSRLVVSWLMVGIGVPILIRADLGVAPFDVLTTGVSEISGWSLGLAFVVCSTVFFVSGWLLGARLGPACVGGTITIGLMVNVWLRVIDEPEPLVARAGMMTAGLVVIAIAICLVVTTEYGPGPSEVVMLGLVHRGLGVVPARWIADGLPLAVGAVLGGSAGVGTVVFVAVMGPLVKLGLRVLRYDPPHVRLAHGRTVAPAGPAPS